MRDIGSTVREVQDRVRNFDPQNVRVVGERIKSGLDAIERIPINEATVPDLFAKMPKLISPRVHAWLDGAVTAYFVGVGAWYLRRGNKGAATTAFVNAGIVAGVSLLTDYDGDGKRPINFKMHGTLDAVQAATALTGMQACHSQNKDWLLRDWPLRDWLLRAWPLGLRQKSMRRRRC